MTTQNISVKTLQSAANLAITQDKPIVLDYWEASLNKECFVGIKESKEQMLVKTEEEYTSPIKKICQSEQVSPEYIVCTENSIYIVSSSIASRKISSN